MVSPGTPHYQDRLQQLTEGIDLNEVRKSMEWMEAYTAGQIVLAFAETAIPGSGPNLRVHHAVDRSHATAPKLIFHFKGASLNDMVKLTDILKPLVLRVLGPMVGNILVDAGESPTFRSQWDLIIFGVPALQTEGVHRTILQAVVGGFREAR